MKRVKRGDAGGLMQVGCSPSQSLGTRLLVVKITLCVDSSKIKLLPFSNQDNPTKLTTHRPPDKLGGKIHEVIDIT